MPTLAELYGVTDPGVTSIPDPEEEEQTLAEKYGVIDPGQGQAGPTLAEQYGVVDPVAAASQQAIASSTLPVDPDYTPDAWGGPIEPFAPDLGPLAQLPIPPQQGLIAREKSNPFDQALEMLRASAAEGTLRGEQSLSTRLAQIDPFADETDAAIAGGMKGVGGEAVPILRHLIDSPMEEAPRPSFGQSGLSKIARFGAGEVLPSIAEVTMLGGGIPKQAALSYLMQLLNAGDRHGAETLADFAKETVNPDSQTEAITAGGLQALGVKGAQKFGGQMTKAVEGGKKLIPEAAKMVGKNALVDVPSAAAQSVVTAAADGADPFSAEGLAGAKDSFLPALAMSIAGGTPEIMGGIRGAREVNGKPELSNSLPNSPPNLPNLPNSGKVITDTPIAPGEDVQTVPVKQAAEPDNELRVGPMSMDEINAEANRIRAERAAEPAPEPEPEAPVKTLAEQYDTPPEGNVKPNEVDETEGQGRQEGRLLDQESAPEPLPEQVAPATPENAGEPVRDALLPPTKPVEPKPEGEPEPNTTSLKNAKVDEERIARGLEPMMAPARREHPKVWDAAMRKIDQDPTIQDRLVSELSKKPRNISDEETALLLERRGFLRTEAFKAGEELVAARESGDSDKLATAVQKADDLAARLQEHDEVSKSVGAEWGRSGRFRQLHVDDDYNLVEMRMKKRMARGGEELPPQVEAELEAQYKKIAELKKGIEEGQAAVSERESKVAIDELIADVIGGKSKKGPKVDPEATKAARKRLFTEENYQMARKRILDKMARTSSNPIADPELIKDLVVVGGYHVENTAMKFEAWSKRMIEDVGESARPHLKAVWDSIADAQGDDVAETASASGKPRKKSGNGNQFQKIARGLIEEYGIDDSRVLIRAVHKIAQRDIDPDMTRRQVQDALSGYGEYRPLSKDEISVKLRAAKGEAREASKLEDLANGIPPPKTGQEHPVPSNKERALTKKVNEFKKKYGFEVTDKETQLKSALDGAKTRMQNQIADYETQIASGEKLVKTKTDMGSDAELDALKARRDELKGVYEQIFGKNKMSDERRVELAIKAAEKSQADYENRLSARDFGPRRNPQAETDQRVLAARADRDAAKQEFEFWKAVVSKTMTPEQVAAKAWKARVARQTAEYREKLARGDFEKRPRKEVRLDKEMLSMKAEMEQAKLEYQRGLEKDRYDRQTVFQKAKGFAGAGWDLSRVLMTTAEASFILRQAKLTAWSHPILTAKAMPNAFRALLNEKNALAADLAIHSHPDFYKAKQSGLHLVDEGARLSKQEEFLMGQWTEKIPVVAGFSRAARVFLNKVRFDVWHAASKSMTSGGVGTPEELKQIAKMVNQFTGRGSYGPKVEGAGVLLGRAFFSPRYLVSRFQVLTGNSLWDGSRRSQKAIAKEYTRAIIGGAMYYALLAGMFSAISDDEVSVELNPKSSDFGKIKIGDTRIDPLAGLSQAITFASRMLTGETKDSKGNIKPLRGDKVAFGGRDVEDVAKTFVRSKVHPAVGAIWDHTTGKKFDGTKPTIQDTITSHLYPITYGDMLTAMKEHDLPEGTAMAILAFFGEGLQTYDANEKKSK